MKASLADVVLSELGLEAWIAEGGGRGWGRHFRQRVSVNRGEWHELLGSGERRGTRVRGLLCKGHLCTHDVVSRSCRCLQSKQHNQVQVPFGVLHENNLSIC